MRKIKQNETGIASLPRDKEGFIDEREIIMLCAKVGLSIESLSDLSPFEFVSYIEGYNESFREFMEYMTVAVYSGSAQIFSKKKFSNPFEKPKEERKKEKVVGSKEGQQHTFDKLKELFGIDIPNEEDDT